MSDPGSSLPPRPSLEQQKKQGKELLRAVPGRGGALDGALGRRARDARQGSPGLCRGPEVEREPGVGGEEVEHGVVRVAEDRLVAEQAEDGDDAVDPLADAERDGGGELGLEAGGRRACYGLIVKLNALLAVCGVGIDESCTVKVKL